ncbi:MAG: response regulator transcription factor [Gammaproteobacteria bacterium]|nr:response regulator transcription factor [Gammaproteobacteria bacterium]MDH3560100.1 response regulator transcription factor [Gammaproteobacteria bacterium]
MSSEVQETTVRVLVASDDQALTTRMAGILEATCSLSDARSWVEALESIRRHQQHILLLDPGLIQDTPKQSVAEVSAESPDTQIMIIEVPSRPGIDQIAFFNAGVHGFCKDDIPPTLLKKAVNAVLKGELWMPRSLITRIVDDYARNRRPSSQTDKSVNCLTPRELEVARMVHKGGNNKTIARNLNISERTVKSHLSAIFRKLNIENRLHLALYFNEIA